MSWSYKIAFLYAGFVLLIVGMVVMAMRQEVDLVSSNYYEQELKYQHKIDKINRTHALTEPLTWNIEGDRIILKFPSQFKRNKIGGAIDFFRPSNAKLDWSVYIKTDTSGYHQCIETKSMAAGVYNMQINWNVNNNEYYNESVITIK